jgi:hypothetical protein
LGGQAGNDAVTGIALSAGQAGTGYTFGELAPASLAGSVRDGGAGIPGVAVTLSGTDDRGNAVSFSAATGQDGGFLFGDLRPGTYTISESQPAGYLDGDETAGSLGGVVADDVIGEIAVGAGQAGTGYTFGEIVPASLSGLTYEDFNDDGEVDFGEHVVTGVTIRLTGTDDRGSAVSLTDVSDEDGAYIFLNLRPGTYTITETQPAGYSDGQETLGTAGGVVGQDQFSQINLGVGADGANYNFGERPLAGTAVQSGQTATIGFWQNKNGQALVKALNGGATATQLGNWLAETFPKMYGIYAGASNLTGKTNAQVAAFYMTLFTVKRQKLDAQVMAVAMATYVTNRTLGGNAGAAYGFSITDDGVGIMTWNVGSCGAAFGVANNTVLTVLDLLLATDYRAVDGLLYNGDQVLRNLANIVYSAINEAGDIS